MTETQRATFEAIALWSQVVCAIVFAVVLVLIFRKYLLPAVAAAQAARNAELANAERRREAVKADVARARAEVEAADRDAASISARVADDAKREAARILAEAKDDGERTVRNAEGELGRARLGAQAQLRAEFIDRALQLARRQADARIDATANARLVDATVDTLVADRVRSAG